MNVNLNATYSSRFVQTAQESAIIIVGGKAGAVKNAPANVFDRVALNPQPLPPKPAPDPGPYSILANVFDRVALNPQPLPPKPAPDPGPYSFLANVLNRV